MSRTSQKIGVLTVAYKVAGNYLGEYVDSLRAQTDQDFELFIVDDDSGLAGELRRCEDLTVHVLPSEGAPASLRKQGIRWCAREGCDFVIFADADDCLNQNRIEVLRNALIFYGSDIVVNELIAFGSHCHENVPLIGARYGSGLPVAECDIKHYNFMGLTNSAVKLDSIVECLDCIPDDSLAFDWDFFAIALSGNRTAVYTSDTSSYYRQYGNNDASIFDWSDERIVRGVEVKRRHYDLMRTMTDGYHELFDEYNLLSSRLIEDLSFKNKYCIAIRRDLSEPLLWWEAIKTVEEVGL